MIDTYAATTGREPKFMTERADVQPWYRHFWPWFVLALLGSTVCASFFMLYLAVKSEDSFVIDRTEGTDVVTARNLAADANARALALDAELVFDSDTRAIHVTLVEGKLESAPGTLELWLSHPTVADRDQRVTLTTARADDSGRPRWSGFLLDSPADRHYVVLSAADSWRLNGVWNGEPELRLTPGGQDGPESKGDE